MIAAHLERMRCPACFGDLAVASVVRGDGDAIEFGLVRCRCASYPVIDGILLLGRRDTGAFVPLLAKGDVAGLVALLAEKRWAGGWFTPVDIEWGPQDVLERAPATLFAAADRIREVASEGPLLVVREVLSHFKYFHATPKYLAALALIEVLRRQAPRHVIDLGSGAGHLGELALRHVQAETVYLVDVTGRSLLLARWMFPDPARCACVRVDANQPLPFKDGAVDAVISADAIHYMESKAALFRELGRVVRRDGSLLLTHLHNAEQPAEPSQGFSLSAQTWRALFDEALGGDGQLLSDEAIREAFAAGRPLGPAIGSAALDGARSFSFVSPRRMLEAPPTAGFLEHPLGDAIFNPVYEVARAGTAIRLSRLSVTPTFDAEHAYPDPPAEHVVEAGALSDRAELARLRRRGILIDAPVRMVDTRGRRAADYIEHADPSRS